MKFSHMLLLPLATLLPALAACGGGSTQSTGGGAGTTGDGGATTSDGGAGGGSGGEGMTAGGSGGAPTTTGGAGGGEVLDPTQEGPYSTATVDETIPSGGDQVPIHCVYPTGGPDGGPYPVVVVGHGFQLPASQYYKYLDHLASFGYIALTADFPTGFFGPDNPGNAEAMIAGIDWAESKFGSLASAGDVGMTGHSLGGKVALLAATMDPRIKASIVLDPVDGGGGPGGGCQPPGCVDVSALMPGLAIPTGFLGETTDAMGGFQPCAPAAENYSTFYAGATSPSFAVTIKGANHMSFLDDAASCGITCSFCNAASLDNAAVNGMARAYVVAFYERHLRGNTGYDTYLTGAKAQELYVQPGTATIESK